MKDNFQRCTRCTVPITWETVRYDEEGVCNICKNWDVKQKEVNWAEREEQFLEICRQAKARNDDYDCIVPFSGGKDSTYTLWAIVKKYGLKPLVVSFDHWFYRPRMLDNRRRTFRRLGAEVLTFTPNWDIVRRLMLESLIRKGDFCWHCHAGVFAYPMQIAVKFKIPLVIWGEGGGEYEAYFKFAAQEQTDEWKFNRRIVLGLRSEDMAGFLGVEERYLSPYKYPAREALKELGVTSVPLGKYHSWNVREHVEVIKKELDWQEDELESAVPGLTYEKIECMFDGIRDYVKYLKRGFSRITHLTTLDIRHGKMSREDAMKYIDEYENRKPQSLGIFLEFLGIAEERFNEIVARHLIAPAPQRDPKDMPLGPKLHDQDMWFRDKEYDGLNKGKVW